MATAMNLGPCQRPECGHPVDDHRIVGHTTKHFGSCPYCSCPIAVFGTTQDSGEIQVGDVADFQFDDGRDLDTNDPVASFDGTGVVEIVSSYGAMIRYAADAHVWMPRKVWGSQVQRRTG